MSLAVLLDTNALLWWLHQPESLSRRACEMIACDADSIFVSPVSAIEIATKSRRGRLQFETPLARQFAAQTIAEGFAQLRITSEHAQLAGGFDNPHKDPWDRLLAAQAQVERLAIVTNDDAIRALGAEIIW